MRKLLLSSSVFVALGVAGSAMAADLPVYTKAPPPYVPDFSWTGFYVGVNAGYGWSTDGVTTSSIGSTTGDVFFGNNPSPSTFLAHLIAGTNTAAVPTSFKNDPHGFLGGVQAGYNMQVNRQWVFGIEADFQGADIKGSDTRQGAATGFLLPGPQLFPLSVSTLATSEQKVDSLGTLRARLGFIPWDSHLLVYATGGLAYGHVESSTSYSQTGCLIFACASPTGAAGSITSDRVG